MKFNPVHIKKPSRPTLISFVLAIIVGFLLTSQFFSNQKVTEVTDPELQKNQALEVSILSSSNTSLRQEVAALQKQQREYDEVLEYRLESTDVLESSLTRYQEASGTTEISGPGVVVSINGPVLDVHLLDLLNNLRNIGVKGVAINGQRVVFDSTIRPDKLQIKLDDQVLTPPYRFEVIGETDLIASSLEREGGLLEQLVDTFPDIEVKIIKKDNLTLPASTKIINWKFAEVVQ